MSEPIEDYEEAMKDPETRAAFLAFRREIMRQDALDVYSRKPPMSTDDL